jgi:hypothetical protein
MARWKLIVAGATVAALVAGVGIAVVIQAVPSTVESAPGCQVAEAADFSEAASLARVCGTDVEVVGERTPWVSSWAVASGGARMEIVSVPTRVERGGEWTALDTTLVADSEAGTLVASASTYPIELNAGGPAGLGQPLGSILRDGKRLDVWFPLALPIPEISGSKATYELGDGIKLHTTISIDGTGFLPVVELANPESAANLATMLEASRTASDGEGSGNDLAFVTEVSDDLSLVKDDDGAIHVRDSNGETHFMASSPVMWDSSGDNLALSSSVTEVGATDRTVSPADGDTIAAMDMDIAGDVIVVSPNNAMLASAATTWPVYIDPKFGGKGAAERVAVRSGGYTGTLYNWDDLGPSSPGQGAGYCSQVASCSKVFKQRLAWEFTGITVLPNLASAEITSAKFQVNGVHSASCTATKTTLHRTSAISGNTVWSNLTWVTPASGSRTEAHSASCGNRGVKEYNALTIVRYGADNNKTSLAMGLKADDETTMTGWKRFGKDAKLEFTYNRAPAIPVDLTLSDPNVPVCVTGAERPVIASTRPTFSARAVEPDGEDVKMSYKLESVGGSPAVAWTHSDKSTAKSNFFQTYQVPAENVLTDGRTYRWAALASDGAKSSVAWSGWCEFSIDTTVPIGPSVVPYAQGAQAIYESGKEKGGVNQQGKFKISRGVNQGDVVAFVYGFNNPASTTTIAPDANGEAIISYTPTTLGLVTLSVKSRDAGGNTSATTNYVFRVSSPTEDAVWALDEGSGFLADDTAGNPSRPLSISGAQWTDGPHALFESRTDDRALTFDGINDVAETDAPVVDTTNSFALAAQVRLSQSSLALGQPFTALSQDGVSQSGFKVRFEPACPGAAAGCWAFTMPDNIDGSGSTTVRSPVNVRAGEWTQLVAEHDKSEHKLRLWVCEIGTPQSPALGDPKKSEIARSAGGWAASGAFVAGRGQSASAPTEWWPGDIDNVRVYSGEIVAETKIRRICQGAESNDFGGDTTALDPTLAVN